MQQLPHWVSILGALLTPLIAVLALFIAWQQWRTNRNKLKLELFERRYAFYEAAMRLIGTIQTSGVSTEDTMLKFLVATRGARFIVGKELSQYFDNDLYRKAVELNGLESELQGLSAGAARSSNVRKQREIKTWLSDQREVLDAKFSPLLDLQH